MRASTLAFVTLSCLAYHPNVRFSHSRAASGVDRGPCVVMVAGSPKKRKTQARQGRWRNAAQNDMSSAIGGRFWKLPQKYVWCP